MKSPVSIVALVAVVIVVLSGISPASAEPFNFNHPIQNDGNQKCLQPFGESMDQGVSIVQEPCDNSRAQDWGFVHLGGNNYRLLNHQSGLCIDAEGDPSNGTHVVQWPCATISNQTWDSGRTLPDVVSLTSRVSGTSSHCLDVPGAQPTDDLALQIYVCNGTSAQSWRIGI